MAFCLCPLYANANDNALVYGSGVWIIVASGDGWVGVNCVDGESQIESTPKTTKPCKIPTKTTPIPS